MIDNNRKALLIGVNDYPQPYALSYCVHDCEELEKLLCRNDDTDESPNFEITRKDNCSNAADANAALKKLFEDDNVVTALFYFSGHGFIDANGQGEIVFPANMGDKTTIYHGLKMEDIMKIVSKSKIKNKIVILDCCNSGDIANADGDEARLPKGCTILASCRADQKASESRTMSHGVFTNMLIQALSGEAADFLGEITVGGIYAYIDRNLRVFEQRPIFKTNISSFISLRSVQPSIPIKRLREGLNLFKSVDYRFQLAPEYEPTVHPNPEEARKTDKCKIFKLLQDLQKIGFVEPSLEELPEGKKFMYYAAILSKSCRLTTNGKNYWNLLNKNKI